MRAVALSDRAVQERIAKSFVPLKVTIEHGAPQFPVNWPAMQGWKTGYAALGGRKNDGFTGCSVVSPDLQTEYANTGSAFVWEMFESTAYDARKFGAMLDRGSDRAAQELAIHADSSLSEAERGRRLARFRADVRAAVAKEGPFHLPPRGFTLEGAAELFKLSGDLPK